MHLVFWIALLGIVTWTVVPLCARSRAYRGGALRTRGRQRRP
jgi:hypothetical protein